MSTRPNAELRRLVIDRAHRCCEYCLIPQEFCGFAHQVDHIIAEKHGGLTDPSNLALSCTTCNRRKASDIASFDPRSGHLTALFHPRQQRWEEHFDLDSSVLIGITSIGRTTVSFLQLNLSQRMMERAELIRAGVYPPVLPFRKPR